MSTKAAAQNRLVISKVDGVSRLPVEISCEELEAVLNSCGRAKGVDVGEREGRSEEENKGNVEVVEPREDGSLDGLWIDVKHPTIEVLHVISRCFEVHQLTIEDCMLGTKTSQKFECFETYKLVVLNELHYRGGEGTGVLEKSGVHMILASDCPCVVTIHNGQVWYLPKVRSTMMSDRRGRGSYFGRERRICNMTGNARMSMRLPEWVMYSIVDTIIESVVRMVEDSVTEIKALEDTIFMYQVSERSAFLYRILETRKRVTYLKSELCEKASLISQMIGQGTWMLLYSQSLVRSDRHERAWRSTEKMSICLYLRHNLNHVLHLVDSLDTSNQDLTNLTLAYFTFVSVEIKTTSVRQNHFMKVIASISAISIPAAIFPTLWSMNISVYFEQFAEPHFGFALITTVLLALVSLCLYFFKLIKYI